MVIETPLGIIEAKESPDPTYPGIWISVNGTDVVLVEFDEDEQRHAVRVWDHQDPDNDHIYRQIIREEPEF
jgi:hypothetical protein